MYRVSMCGSDELRNVWDGSRRSVQSDCAACATNDTIHQYNNPSMSDHLRHAGNELPEFMCGAGHQSDRPCWCH
jgi:hypothetical protein